MRWLASRPLAQGKAMLRAGLALALGLLCGFAATAQAQPASERAGPPTLTLEDGGRALWNPVAGRQWIDASGRGTLEQVLAGQGVFTPWDPDRIHALGATGVLWIHLRVARPAAAHAEWLAELPLPPLDSVTLYQQDRAGGWRAESAGDRIAVASWPLAGRFPVFRLQIPPGEVRDLYLRVQHNARSNVPLQLATVTDHGSRMEIAYLGLGLVLGGLLLLIGACLVQAWVFRDLASFGYALYTTTITLAMAAHTGAAGHLLWPYSGRLADVAQGALGLLAAAASLLFVRFLSAATVYRPPLARLAGWMAGTCVLAIVAYGLLDRPSGTVVLGGYLGLALALSFLMACLAWRRGNQPSLWILVSYLPLAVGVGITMLRIYGLMPASWVNQYGVVAAMAVHVPLLLIALNIHARESHGAIARESALSSQDALTGVLASHLFHDRLQQLVARHRRRGDAATVLFIDLANYPAIRAQHGAAVAEQSLLRSAIKLRRLLREPDTLSRIGEARFGVILEHMASRVTVLDRAARVVAAARLPIKGQRPEVGLQFHIAAALLQEAPTESPELEQALASVLAAMPPNTSQPIRFVGAPVAGSPDGPDSRRPEDESGLRPVERPAPV